MEKRWAWARWTCLGLAAFAAAATAEAPATTTPGRVLFVTYCASCHGSDGRGQGPAAAALRTPPADLTRLSEKYGTPLSREPLAAFIDGREDVIAHGPREMPVWGRRFLEEGDPASPQLHAEAAVHRTILVLIDYLESIQRRRSAGPPIPRAPGDAGHRAG
jgi:mono/diheme cytochrome c family protein